MRNRRTAAVVESPDVAAGGPDGSADKLRDIQSVVDTALSALDPAALLAVLAGRVKDVLRADTAAVLLLDRESGELVATAASGLEEEVRQGVRIPVGGGFAGRIAEERRVVIIDDVDETNVLNPILLATGVRSLIGAPLLAGGSVLGVLHVGTLSSRRFDNHDAGLLELAADRAAVAVQSMTAQLDRAAAEALQRSLVPSAFPMLDGLEMAGRYIPGSGNVGGDWYDVFTLPSGEVGAVIGDVTGTGLRAAVIMGRIRSALRAYALETADPADVLGRLDAKMRHFEPDAMATVLYAVFDTSLDQVRISCAGHLPPVITRAGQPAEIVQVAADLLIGVSAWPRRTTTISFPPGSALCLYTDGLVERRDRPVDDGIARLRSAMAATGPRAACAKVMAAMAQGTMPSDDIALLILRRPPSEVAARGLGRKEQAPAHE